MSVNLGQVLGSSTGQEPGIISFSVDQKSLDFGLLNKGASAEKQVKISNNGSTGIHVESVVSGDSLFVENLSVNNAPWQKFKNNLTAGQSENEKLKLTVPKDFPGSGQKNGQLVFWASAE